MEQPSCTIPFYATFGEFKQGYNREEAETGINEAFHARQKERHERYLRELMLGSGLGDLAKRTVQDGLYQPQAALRVPNHVTSAAAAVVATTKTTTVAVEGEGEGKENGVEGNVFSASSLLPDMALLDTSPSTLMGLFTSGVVEVQSMAEVQRQLDDNVKVAEESIARGCAPFTFAGVLDSLSMALRVLEEGDARTQVKLSMQEEGTAPLKGAEAVMVFAREHIIPLVSILVNILYATEWMLQYTMTFANSLVAKDEEEAQVRLELLARCVRWLGKIDQFVAFAFMLELTSERYELLEQLRKLAERHVKDVITKVEKDMKSVLLVPFPKRREGLLTRKRKINENLQRAFAFLSDIELNWMPSVRLEVEWKNELFAWVFERIHTVIAPGYLSASLGFIDESLYVLVPNEGTSSLLSMLQFRHSVSPNTVELTPKVSIATLVETGRVEKKWSFQYIGVVVKEIASSVVGLQLCMGARHVLQQYGAEHDARWGFSMAHVPLSPNVVREVKDRVLRFTDTLQNYVGEIMDKKMNTNTNTA